MFFGITEISKMWVVFPYCLCTFFRALHVACSIDLCDSSHRFKSRSAISTLNTLVSDQREVVLNPVIYFSITTSVQNQTLAYETKPPVLNNQMNPTWRIPVWFQHSRGRALSPIDFHGGTTGLAC